MSWTPDDYYRVLQVYGIDLMAPPPRLPASLEALRRLINSPGAPASAQLLQERQERARSQAAEGKAYRGVSGAGQRERRALRTIYRQGRIERTLSELPPTLRATAKPAAGARLYVGGRRVSARASAADVARIAVERARAARDRLPRGSERRAEATRQAARLARSARRVSG